MLTGDQPRQLLFDMENQMTSLYKVTVRFDTISPMYQEKTFKFSSKEEAEKFCDKVDQLTSWPFTVPLSCQPEEIFCADSAFGWCLDEIEACKKSVAA